jgi:hypothetical protein
MTPIKTLAELKRRVQVGTKFTLTQSDRHKPEYIGSTRTVTQVNTTGVSLSPIAEGAQEAWLDWPKASQLRFVDNPDGKTIILLASAASVLIYEIQFNQ